jgi:hypothetical protein
MMEGIVCLIAQHPRVNVAVQAFICMGLPAQRHDAIDKDRTKIVIDQTKTL